jgi:hypothetical protein
MCDLTWSPGAGVQVDDPAILCGIFEGFKETKKDDPRLQIVVRLPT